MPLQCEYFALEGVTELKATLTRVRRALNPAIVVEGVLLTMVDERTNLTQQVAARSAGTSRDGIQDTSAAERATRGGPNFGKPMILYDIRSRGAEAYLQLAREIMAESQMALFAR